jgi:hypothetical protein
MAALDFPASPSDGDIYENYVYNGTIGAWVLAASSGNVVVSGGGGFDTTFLLMGA